MAGHGLGLINPALYTMEAAGDPGIVDVTAGTNTVTFPQGGSTHTVKGCHAVNGYDLSTGVGTVNAAPSSSNSCTRSAEPRQSSCQALRALHRVRGGLAGGYSLDPVHSVRCCGWVRKASRTSMAHVGVEDHIGPDAGEHLGGLEHRRLTAL